ncbi:cupin domain-containing protein [Fimbriiglobus ruber]|uniref:Cupin type-2 domain-containing protein n=1 Tax=Fimbriiglobus ruber TaxID=1908690 RepID=A0A225DN76_9BACT|nr:cupin domain-containing protein [Fimbriiglobus ruber]OWK42920.1 hypothetical protein FRUB_02517 [Fimbriiglobus ruber]
MDLIHRPSGNPDRQQQLGPYRIEALIDRAQAAAGTVYRVHVAPGATTSVSYHAVAEEYYFVIAGGGAAVLDGVDYDISPGDFLRLPPGTRHGFRAGPAGLDMLDVHTPGCWPDHDTYFPAGEPAGWSKPG